MPTEQYLLKAPKIQAFGAKNLRLVAALAVVAAVAVGTAEEGAGRVAVAKAAERAGNFGLLEGSPWWALVSGELLRPEKA